MTKQCKLCGKFVNGKPCKDHVAAFTCPLELFPVASIADDRLWITPPRAKQHDGEDEDRD